MTIDVVMLSYTKNMALRYMTQDCLRSLHISEPDHDFHVWMMESNKGIEKDCYPNCDVIIPDEEFNYNRFCEIGLQYCKNEWVVLCNNDLIFHPGWFTAILKTKQDLPNAQSFSPWNTVNRWHDYRMKGRANYYIGYNIGDEIAGWCIVAKREIFNKVKLDDRVKFWFSDNIYVDELIKHHIDHVLVRDSIVDHLNGRTLFTMGDQLKSLTEGQLPNYLMKNPLAENEKS